MDDLKYTILDGKKRTPFIQQKYDSIEEAKKRLDQLTLKFADRYQLVIVGVDDQGAFHELPAEEKLTAK